MRHAVIAALLLGSAASAQEPVDLDMVNRIRDEGFNRSQVMDHLGYLTDVVGPRLTGSPAMKEANDWTLSQFESWGLENGGLEGYEFGRGWTYSKVFVRMTAPRVHVLQAQPVSWHPGTDGAIEADVIHAEIGSPDDFEEWRGKLAGKIVLVSGARDHDEPDGDDWFRRWTGEQLDEREQFPVPTGGGGGLAGFANFINDARAVDAFLKEEGVLAVVKRSGRDAALINASGYLHRTGETPQTPTVAMTSEDYERLLRLLDRDLTVSLELEVDAQFHDEDSQAYNTVAEIRGRGRDPEIVMAGAHLDSWFMGDGAVDNGAGSAVIMEAARILSALGVQPRRTIRFALWSGEEQGLHGSVNYVREHFADRPPPDDEELVRLGGFFWFGEGGPIEPKPEHAKLSAYFNLDNGSGRIRGVYAEGNAAAAPIFESWLEPFHDLGATSVSTRSTGGTDHLPYQWVGLPGYQFIQDPLDYGARLHHTQIDTFDHAYEADLKQASVIMATFLYNAAMRDERMPRKPMPQ